MCGIAGIHVKDSYIGRLPIDAMADYLLLGIEYRGKHATGYASASADGKTVAFEKGALTASDFVRQRRAIPEDAKTVLLHTRWATQGGPENNANNHPVLYDTCFVVHNGHINNDNELFPDGKNRPAEVDSIAIAAALSQGGLDTTEHIKEALEKLRGQMAIAAVDPTNTPGKLVLAKGWNSPLIVLNHPKCIIWASDKAAIDLAWQACMGTVTKKYAKLYGDNIRWQGFTSLAQGDLWEIEDDRVKRSNFRYSQYIRHDEDYVWPYRDSSARRESVALPTTKRKWDCTPNFWDCEHPCTPGCASLHCYCVEGSELHPKKDNVSPIGTALARQFEQNKHLSECWGCDEKFITATMEELFVENGQPVLICRHCAEWEGEDEDPTVDSLDGKLADTLRNEACAELAFENNCSEPFVQWLLFDAVDKDFEDDEELKEIQEAMRKEYVFAYAIARKKVLL